MDMHRFLPLSIRQMLNDKNSLLQKAEIFTTMITANYVILYLWTFSGGLRARIETKY